MFNRPDINPLYRLRAIVNIARGVYVLNVILFCFDSNKLILTLRVPGQNVKSRALLVSTHNRKQ